MQNTVKAFFFIISPQTFDFYVCYTNVKSTPHPFFFKKLLHEVWMLTQTPDCFYEPTSYRHFKKYFCLSLALFNCFSSNYNFVHNYLPLWFAFLVNYWVRIIFRCFTSSKNVHRCHRTQGVEQPPLKLEGIPCKCSYFVTSHVYYHPLINLMMRLLHNVMIPTQVVIK